jgi:hypothetical protein
MDTKKYKAFPLSVGGGRRIERGGVSMSARQRKDGGEWTKIGPKGRPQRKKEEEKAVPDPDQEVERTYYFMIITPPSSSSGAVHQHKDPLQ